MGERRLARARGGPTENLSGRGLYITRLLGIDRQARDVNQLGWRDAGQMASDLIWIAQDGSTRILYAAQGGTRTRDNFWPSVLEADVATGRTRTVHMPYEGVLHWAADASGTVRMGYGYNDRFGTARLLYRDGSGDAFRTISRANTRADESLLIPSVFLPDRTRAIAVSDSEGFDAVYELSLPDLTLGRKIFGVEGFDVDGIIETRAGDGIAGIRYTGDRARIEWMDPVMRDAQANLELSVGAGRATIMSWNRDRTKLLVHVGGASQPGAYYLYDTNNGSATRIAWLNDALGEQELAPVRTIRYRARDGVEISAVLTLPRGREARNLPVIVMPHGGPFARDEERWDWEVQFLADRGYAVIQPNYRGSSGYGSAFAELGEGQWGHKMQDDLNDALAYLVEQGIGDGRRACMVGSSYGGYAALRAAQRDPTLYRCAVSFAGVSDLGAWSRYDRSFLNNRGRRKWLRDQAPDLGGVSPINHAASFGIPVLLVHGDKDSTVPVSQSRQMAERLRAANKDFRYVEQEDGDHNFSRSAHREEYLRELEAFLDRHNPA